MEAAIKAQYNDLVLYELMGRYEIHEDHIKPLGGFESFVYQFCRGEQEYILRISHTGLRRSREEILAEVDFINYLADHGVSVARALPSPRGNLLETADEANPQFAAVCFDKAPGGPPQQHHWTQDFVQHYGQVMGQMHRLTKDYTPSNPAFLRPQGEKELIGFAERFLPPQESEIIGRWNTLLASLHRLPRDQNAYGLIHQDIHGGNFFVDANNHITVFDFDDSQYFWFAHDIAMALFYVVPHHCDQEKDISNARYFIQNFLKGYERENKLSDFWIQEIPTFLTLREIDLYIAIHRSMDLHHLDPWCASFMNGRREKILRCTPYIPAMEKGFFS